MATRAAPGPVTPPNRALSRNPADYARRVVASLPFLPLVAHYLVRRTFDRTMMGFWWIVLRALTPAAAMALVFTHVSAFQTTKVPYPVFLLCGMTVWIVVDIGLSQGMRSLFAGRRLQRMIGLPGFLFPLASLAMPLIHAAVLLACAVAAMAVYRATGAEPSSFMRWQLLALPALAVLVLMLVCAIGAFVSVAFVLTRDMRFVVPLLTQVWFFATPVLYPLSALPAGWQTLSLYLNPLTPILEASRSALFGVPDWPSLPLVASIAWISVLFVGGLWFMTRSEWALREMG